MSERTVAALASQAFGRARWKAFLRAVRASILGRYNRLLAYREVREHLRLGGPVYRGLQSVPLDKVVGSVDRYRDFDKAFLPSQDHTAMRWKSIGRAFYQDVNLPPVRLYKVGEVYFVVDGNHRVSVARELGREFIDAEVQECSVRVPVGPDLDPSQLQIKGEYAEFQERTGLDKICPDADITLTIAGGYYELLEHIAVHRYFMAQEESREVSAKEAVAHWYEHVYTPMVRAIREHDILRDFPGRTEADLYLWVMQHQYYLRERFGAGVDAVGAALDFAERFTPRLFKRVWRRLTRPLTSHPDLSGQSSSNSNEVAEQ